MAGAFGLTVGASIAMALQSVEHQIMVQSKCDPMSVARQTIAKRYPSFDPTGLTPVISDDGNLWELTYELPPSMLGGVPVVTVDKRTCTVVRAAHTQ